MGEIKRGGFVGSTAGSVHQLLCASNTGHTIVETGDSASPTSHAALPRLFVSCYANDPREGSQFRVVVWYIWRLGPAPPNFPMSTLSYQNRSSVSW